MEDPVKEQKPSESANGEKSTSLSARLQRYPLRSATKPKEVKPPLADASNSSAPRRARLTSKVSKSIGVLDLSGKEKSAKPPRRLSTPANKSIASTGPRPVGNITPISEARSKRSFNNIGQTDTPTSDVSKSSSRRKFNVLSSASYWLSQIKLSESAAKHMVTLGFFKLALEAGCEPLQRMRDEFKSYVHRHNLVELGEPVKKLIESYNIVENLEQLQVSETCTHLPEDGNRSSDDDVHSSVSITDIQKLKPKPLDADAAGTGQVKDVNKKNSQKSSSVIKDKRSPNKNAAINSKHIPELNGSNRQKKQPQKPKKQQLNKEKVKKQGKKSAKEEG